MSTGLPERIKRLRENKGISQKQLAEMVFASRSTVANWETGRRIPDLMMLRRLAETFGVEVGELIAESGEEHPVPEVIVVDDEKIVLAGCLEVIEKALPDASIVGFTNQHDAITYAKTNRISLAFLDIEMGSVSGLDLCKELLEIDPHTNVIYVTAHKEYAFDAWETGASGFLLKPPTVDEVKAQLEKLRYPVKGL